MNTGEGVITSETRADESPEAMQIYEQQVSQGEERVRESRESIVLGVNGRGEELEDTGGAQEDEESLIKKRLRKQAKVVHRPITGRPG